MGSRLDGHLEEAAEVGDLIKKCQNLEKYRMRRGVKIVCADILHKVDDTSWFYEAE